MQPRPDLTYRPPARAGRNTRWIAPLVYWSLFAVVTALILHYMGVPWAGWGNAVFALVLGLGLGAMMATVFTYGDRGRSAR